MVGMILGDQHKRKCKVKPSCSSMVNLQLVINQYILIRVNFTMTDRKQDCVWLYLDTTKVVGSAINVGTCHQNKQNLIFIVYSNGAITTGRQHIPGVCYQVTLLPGSYSQGNIIFQDISRTKLPFFSTDIFIHRHFCEFFSGTFPGLVKFKDISRTWKINLVFARCMGTLVISVLRSL